MARVTVEDCVTIIPNRFELCLIASNRAKSILAGAPTSFDKKEKPAVISLREVAEGLVDSQNIKENIISSVKNRGIVNFSEVNEQEEVSQEHESYEKFATDEEEI